MKLEPYEALRRTREMTHDPDTFIWKNELFEVITHRVGVRYWHVHLRSVVSVLPSLNLLTVIKWSRQQQPLS